MNKIKKIFQRLVAGMLVLGMMVSTFGTNAVYAMESEEDIEFKAQVRADHGMLYDGKFIVHDGELYVDVETVANMAVDVSNFAYMIGSDKYVGSISRGETTIEYMEDEMVGDCVPFAKTMTFLGLAPYWSAEEKSLQITEAMNLDELSAAMVNIHNTSEYNMEGWQNTKDMGGYDTHIELAMVADCVKNWEYVSYITGAEQKAMYERAFWDIMLQDENADDETSFLYTTANAGKAVEENYSLARKHLAAMSDIGQMDISIYSDQLDTLLTGFGEAVDYMQVEELADFVAFSSIVGNEEDSCVRGVDLIVNSDYVSRTNESMASVGKAVLRTYREDEPIWKGALQEFARGAIKDVEKKAWETVIYAKAVADAMNKASNEALGTQKQVDATLQAAAFLDIQRLSGRYFSEMRNQYRIACNKGDWENAASYLQNARDAMIVYLQCGAEAYRAMAIDDQLGNVAKDVVMHINEELMTVSMYQDGDFNVADAVWEAQTGLMESAEELAALAEKTNEDGMIVFQIVWDSQAKDMLYGRNFDPDYIVSGTAEDGSAITYAEDEGCYYKADGSLTAKKFYSEGEVLLEMYDLQGSYQIMVENMSFPTNEWSEYTEVFYKDAAGEMHTAGFENYIRGVTGYWYYNFDVSGGVVK